jgi:hypothetical protein
MHERTDSCIRSCSRLVGHPDEVKAKYVDRINYALAVMHGRNVGNADHVVNNVEPLRDA